MKCLYPEISPYHRFFLNTSSQHSVYIEESGTVTGIPVIFLHGGPCSGTQPHHRRFFNPEKYRIILMDQRGCGLSLPYGEWKNNRTQDLINDIELVRQQLNIDQWLLFGGSWGATLALLYAQQYKENVVAMIIRGVFLARKKDLDWFINGGVGSIYPECWQNLISSIPKNASKDLLANLHAAVFSDNELLQRRVAKAWMTWGMQVALGAAYQMDATFDGINEKMLKQVQMELHYATHHYFIDENQILAQCPLLKTLPTIIIHGRYDLMCPMEAALSLHQALPKADYCVLSHSGHVARGDEMIDALITATDTMAHRLKS